MDDIENFINRAAMMAACGVDIEEAAKLLMDSGISSELAYLAVKAAWILAEVA